MQIMFHFITIYFFKPKVTNLEGKAINLFTNTKLLK